MKNSPNIDLKSLQPLLKKARQVILQRAIFIAVLAVLFVYLFVVWQINQLSNAEPSDDAETAALAKSTIPVVNKNAISQIQSLEQTNTPPQPQPIQNRDNPFQE